MQIPLSRLALVDVLSGNRIPTAAAQETIGKSDEKVNMHACPEDPPCKTCKPDEAQVGDRVCSANDREITFIPIPERFRLLTPFHTAPNDVRNVLTFLYSRLSYSRHQHRRSGSDPK